MMISSEKEARNVLKVGSIVNHADSEIKVVALHENEVECVDVVYEDDEYKDASPIYYRTYKDFIKNEIV